jgi:hypothetical protein
MLIPVAELRRACVAEEAALQAKLAEAVRLFTPPLSRARCGQVRVALEEAKQSCTRLSWLWAQHMMDPALHGLPPLHPDRQFFDALHRRMRPWSAGYEALTRVLRQGRLPLLPHPPAPDAPEAVQLAVQDRAWLRLHGHLGPVADKAPIRSNGQYADIPLPMEEFLRHLQLARRVGVAQGKRALRFLDVGCGVGLKVLVAAEMMAVADGLEYQPDLARAAGRMLRRAGIDGARVVAADALTFDGFGGYDVIYFYKPIHTPDVLAEMEARIIAQARDGTILIAPYAGFSLRAEAQGCGGIAGFVSIKGVTGKDLVALRARVAQVGFGDPRPVDPPEGFMAPLMAALRAWGHL